MLFDASCLKSSSSASCRILQDHVLSNMPSACFRMVEGTLGTHDISVGCIANVGCTLGGLNTRDVLVACGDGNKPTNVFTDAVLKPVMI